MSEPDLVFQRIKFERYSCLSTMVDQFEEQVVDVMDVL